MEKDNKKKKNTGYFLFICHRNVTSYLISDNHNIIQFGTINVGYKILY